MKVCAKCGRANDVTRKYCTRCGASLLKVAEEQKPKPTASIPEVGRVTTGASLKRAEESEEPLFSETSTDSEEERIVRPSEVSPDRVRTAERHMEKTEYERAQETFASSEKMDPSERMLRASELQGLEEETYEEGGEQPQFASGSLESESEPIENEQGKEVVKQILERVKAAEARARVEEEMPLEDGLDPQDEQPSLGTAEAVTYDAPVDAIKSPPDALFSSAEKTKPTESVFEPSFSTATAASEEPVRDEKIRMIDSDIKTFNMERQQLQSEYGKLQGRLDEEVERYRTVAETKRIHAEGIERELRTAKKEYDDANKEYKNVENRRKKELFDAEKRIGDVDKRVKKAEEAKEKRIRDLEKERLKREEEARKALATS